MITCVVEYVIDPAKIDAFERFARRWMELVNLHGGTHHGSLREPHRWHPLGRRYAIGYPGR